MGSTHLKALRAVSGVELAAVCSNDPIALSGDLRRIQGNIGGPGELIDFSGIRKSAEVEPVLADPALTQSISAFRRICTPAVAMEALARRQTRAGGKADGARWRSRGSDGGRSRSESASVLMTAQVLRFFPAVRRLARSDAGRDN